MNFLIAGKWVKNLQANLKLTSWVYPPNMFTQFLIKSKICNRSSFNPFFISKYINYKLLHIIITFSFIFFVIWYTCILENYSCLSHDTYQRRNVMLMGSLAYVLFSNSILHCALSVYIVKTSYKYQFCNNHFHLSINFIKNKYLIVDVIYYFFHSAYQDSHKSIMILCGSIKLFNYFRLNTCRQALINILFF